MPLDASKLEPLLGLLTGLSQRQEVIRQLASQIQTGTIWRSPDGTLAVKLTPQQQAEIETLIKTYLDESDTIIAMARALLAPTPP